MSDFFNFLDLPGELRNMIYRYTLTTDPPDEQREHKFDCHLCTWDPRQLPSSLYQAGGKRIPGGCRCWARTGLSLLLVNRQIYWEGASIFWAENTFTFLSPQSFCYLVGTRLRPLWRKRIRSISLPGNNYNVPDTIKHKFWRVLVQCQGIRNLELVAALTFWLPPRHPTRNRPDVVMAYWEDLRRLLPELKTFTLMAGGGQGWRGEMVLTRSVSLKEIPLEQFGVVGAQVSAIHHVVIHEMLSWLWHQRPPSNLPSWMEFLEGTEDADETVCIMVRFPTYTVKFAMRFLCPPLSPKTIARNKALREARDKSLLKTKADV